MITTRRAQKPAQSGIRKVHPVDDALSGDGFQKAKTAYEHLKTVTPIFTPSLTQAIQQAIEQYERETGLPIQPACRKRLFNSHNPSHSPQTQWFTNKQIRLKAALSVFSMLYPASTATEAINQMACVLALLEKHAAARPHLIPGGFSLDPTPLRLTEPVQETLGGVPLLVSYGIQHVSLFNRQGAVQIQSLPEHLRGADYRQRSALPEIVILDKAGADGQSFW